MVRTWWKVSGNMWCYGEMPYPTPSDPLAQRSRTLGIVAHGKEGWTVFAGVHSNIYKTLNEAKFAVELLV